MIDRRLFVTSLLTLPALSALTGAVRADEALACTKSYLTEDGLHMQPWFIQNSFLDLREEFEAAREKGKRLVLMVEIKGCPYCKETHERNFTDPRVCSFVRKNFEILQINKQGDREVTDFDGETLTEKQFTKKYAAYYTPNLMFLPDNLDDILKRKPKKRTVARIQGYMEPDMFLEMFKFVHDKGYEKGSFIDYVKKQAKSG